MRKTDIQEKEGNTFGVGSNSNSEATLTTILRKIESLEIGKNKMSAKAPIFHAEMQACATCDDVGHYTQDFPLIHEIWETRKDQVNMFYQKPSSFPYNQSHHQGNYSGRNNSNNYFGRPYYQVSNSNQNQGGASFTPNHQPFQQNTPYIPPQNRKPSSDDGILALLQSNNQLMQQFMQMNLQSMSRIETSIVQLASGLSTRDKGTFPSQTQPNLKDQTESLHCDQANTVITLRSGRTVDNKVRMPEDKSRESPNPSTEKVVEGGKPICEETPFVEEETGQVSLSEKIIENDPPRIPRAPFPQQFLDNRKNIPNEEVKEMFKNLKITIHFLDVLRQIPFYAKHLKDLCTFKKRHMKLIYQICANTGMYSSKDELLKKDVELSNTRVPYGEVTILENNSLRLTDCLQRDDEEPMKLLFRTVKQRPKSQVERKESLLDKVALEETELEVVLEDFGISKKKRVKSIVEKVLKSQLTRLMTSSDCSKKKGTDGEKQASLLKTPGMDKGLPKSITSSKLARTFPKRQPLKCATVVGTSGIGVHY
ncbi:hypothetical protein GIB67_008931 [Kingdonia uniflora]|uniref:Uncharacterized protein n=1 Tax=Kingdonia uniflora TaxID=39325 RepID=A0A7J7LVK0_9MAGN|nr:hypothetical protein GIB67_008931 [Kingdonia uniflora]